MIVKCGEQFGALAVFLLICLGMQGVKSLINDLCDAVNGNADTCRIAHSYCQQAERALHGLCTCRKGFVASQYERYCLPVVGVPCASNVDCLVADAVCNAAGRCACAGQHVAAPDRTSCIPPLGRRCRADHRVECDVTGANCVDGVCACGKQYVANRANTTCLPVLGQYCMVDGDCTVRHSTCANGLCACPRLKYVESRNKTTCLPLVHHVLREACVQDTQCTHGQLGLDTACVNSQCVCRYGLTKANETCEAKKQLDDWCTHTQQCQMIEHASCVQNKCSCDPYYVALPGNRSHCVPIALLYGASCTDRVQCTAGYGSGSHCHGGVCLCVDDHHFVVNYTGRCIPNRMLGETCTHDNQCYLPRDGVDQHVACVDNACACTPGHAADVDETTCSAGVSVHTTATSLVSTLLALSVALLIVSERSR